MKEIRTIGDLSEEERQRVIVGIMGYSPVDWVRDKIIQKAIDFKWTDSEQAGLDLYSAISDPIDRLIVAGFEWRKQHWQEFFRAEDTNGHDARKIG